MRGQTEICFDTLYLLNLRTLRTRVTPMRVHRSSLIVKYSIYMRVIVTRDHIVCEDYRYVKPTVFSRI